MQDVHTLRWSWQQVCAAWLVQTESLFPPLEKPQGTTVAGLVFPSMTMRDTLIKTGLVGDGCGCCFLFVYKKYNKCMLIDFEVYRLYWNVFWRCDRERKKEHVAKRRWKMWKKGVDRRNYRLSAFGSWCAGLKN